MRVSSRYRPETVACTDTERPELLDPFLDATAQKLVATDGVRLLALPIDVDAGERSRYIAGKFLKTARDLHDAGDITIAENLGQEDELRPNGLVWPCDQSRTFPMWRQAVPPYDEKTPGTFTFGVNAKLLKGLADALGSGGEVALTVHLEDPMSPIVVKNPYGDAREIAVLMPMRVRYGQTAEKKADDAETKEDPRQIVMFEKLEPATAVEELTWDAQGAGLLIAEGKGGDYHLVRDLDDPAKWKARWAPQKGKEKQLAFLVSDKEAKRACRTHHLERLADASLAAAGSDDLNRSDLKGEATKYKH